MNWNSLQEVYEKCRIKGISFSLNYAESEDAFYFIIDSNCPIENFVGKSRPFDLAISSVIEFLDNCYQRSKVNKESIIK